MEKKKILIVDDETGFSQMFKLNLEKTGSYEVDTAGNGPEGIERVQKKPYDVVFMDVLMPKMEGREVLEAIKRKQSAPVIVISAYLPPDKKREILEAGAFTSLQKPIRLEQAIDAIHEALAAEEKRKFLDSSPQAEPF